MSPTTEFHPPELHSYPAMWRIDTRWEDNDHYGHVNNVKYYSYFDSAVNGWLMHATGVDIRELGAVGLVAESMCTYLRSVSFPDQLMVGLSIERLGRSSVTYSLGLFVEVSAVQVCAATCRFVHVYVDRATRQTVTIPDRIRTAASTIVVAED
ncbi:acyl-CoA thioesterase [Gordonia sp. SID5947]|uniref:acyl-CoA thioesterase n=1 Tax=Gordonia sp. SID5947 TaxID=2690315 RepID=UPI001369CAE6|nr:thioesterase family protein [Gordonia sp. SID5947]MYR07937.1 acyl-CoA thioesterase [Gordonia sp. SID5947]